ncbi:alanine dehydrogenase [Cyanobacterium sp. IPPAS B-1200]|uniref:alanine dehydrogenase n=1 Tax=Cyanobacterium sp. IPPAS B-1200 TaxID=1562720 RepID=UPI00085271D8|nr:alanine dehydrogenase [Cyanobacterium sp. IPPAS B-1200]OEJ78341.1 alanine dehydrogenase [Cyanobacterium sp. IPPAS B-1200]
MKIGIPKEIKDQEFRVGLTPASVKILSAQNHEIFVEKGAGLGSGFTDEDYELAGATITDHETTWNQEMVVKVKEPLPQEYSYIKQGQILFTYLHLAADRTLTESLIKSGVTAIAYETVQLPDGRLPLLTPMSIIAGRLSVQIGARYLEKQQGGKGILLGGIPGVAQGNIVILGGGIVGTEAAKIAVGMGAKVTILDVNIDRLAYLENIFGSRVELLYSNSETIAKSVIKADLLIGAVLITGKKAPILVPRELVKKMSLGSVIIDVAVDQGGCIETLHTTSHSKPSYIEEGVIHLGIPNLPGAVPRTATQALNNNTLSYVMKLANQGIGALKQDPTLAQGLNVHYNRLVHPAVQQVFPDLPQ